MILLPYPKIYILLVESYQLKHAILVCRMKMMFFVGLLELQFSLLLSAV